MTRHAKENLLTEASQVTDRPFSAASFADASALASDAVVEESVDLEGSAEATEGLPAPRGRVKAQLLVWLIRIAILGAIVALWQLTAAQGWIKPLFIGEPSGIAKSFFHIIHTKVVTVDLRVTLEEVLVGYVIGCAAGFVSGLVLARMALLNRAVQPILTAFNSLPRIALAPLFILWFGLGEASKIATSVSLCYFIMLANTMAALQNTDRDFLLLARSMGATERQRLMKFVLPSGAPVLAAGLQLCLVYSFLGAVSTEMIGGVHGLGVILTSDSNTLATNDLFSVLVLLVIVTSAMSGIIRLIEKRALRWHYIEMRGLE